jgi:hypothetical protein
MLDLRLVQSKTDEEPARRFSGNDSAGQSVMPVPGALDLMGGKMQFASKQGVRGDQQLLHAAATQIIYTGYWCGGEVDFTAPPTLVPACYRHNKTPAMNPNQGAKTSAAVAIWSHRDPKGFAP